MRQTIGPSSSSACTPLDNEIPDFKPDRDTGLRIYRANIAMMDKAHFIAANVVRFRGPGMDAGTAFEIGYMRGAGKPVFGYYDAKPFYGKSEAPRLYADKVAAHYKRDPKNPSMDIDGQSIESFAMADNLMIIGALDDAGSKTIRRSARRSCVLLNTCSSGIPHQALTLSGCRQAPGFIKLDVP